MQSKTGRRWWCGFVCLISVSAALAAPPEAPPVRNVIVMVMDGTGAAHTTLSRWCKGSDLNLDAIAAGAVRTYCSNSIITDSAAAATAFACGTKTTAGFLGLRPQWATVPGVPPIAKDRQFEPAASVLEGARSVGKAVGLVATCNIQHATPAGFSVHWPDRGDYLQIARQQVYQNLDVVFGGGRKYLLPVNRGGTRTDGEDLLAVLKSRGYAVIGTREELLKTHAPRIWGLFAEDAMAFDLDRRNRDLPEPSLAQMTKKAIELLSRNPKGFFLFVEGSKIDWASHTHDPVGVVSDVLAFDAAVGEALAFARRDGRTMVLAFADHGNGGMSLNNGSWDTLIGPLRKAALTPEGIRAKVGADCSAATIRKAAQLYGITDLTAEEAATLQKAGLGQLGPLLSGRIGIVWTTWGHTGEDLILYAWGPGHPTGVIENTDLARAEARGMGFDLAEVSRRLFVPVDAALKGSESKWRIDQTDKANPVLIVQTKTARYELPFSRNVIKTGGVTREFQGLTVLAPKTGRAYVPQEALDLIK